MGEPHERRSREDTVFAYLAEFIGDYDFDGTLADYRAAINAALPDGVALRDDEFYGSYPHDPDDYEIDDVVEPIDPSMLAENHDHSAE